MYVYHVLLGDKVLRGDTLYPLNELSLRHPDLHEGSIMKYSHRQHILAQRIPHLDCLWGDVIFLSPVHPEKVHALLSQCFDRVFPPFAYQQIPVADLDKSKLVIWPFFSREFDPDEVVRFDNALLESAQDVPTATREYFSEEREKNRFPLLFVHIPHVLYKGAIDVSAYPILHT